MSKNDVLFFLELLIRDQEELKLFKNYVLHVNDLTARTNFSKFLQARGRQKSAEMVLMGWVPGETVAPVDGLPPPVPPSGYPKLSGFPGQTESAGR